MATAVLKTENLKKVIGSRTIVSDISLEIYEGEIFGFLGPNGAGKTTTIKMIVGLSRISGGDIFINGCSIKKDFKTAIKNVGCIVENPELYKYMSGLDNLRLFARLYDDVDDARIQEVVDIVDLGRAIKSKVKTYSLGMKQRLGIAQALLHRPKLIILDEPTNGLDPAGIKEMRQLLRRLVENDKITVFVSSHILGEMQQMCDRVGIINGGRIITVKPVQDIINMAGNDDRAILLVKTDDNEKASELLEQAGIENKAEPDGIHVETKRENVPNVVTTLASAGISVYGMDNINASTLEDVFMKLTGDNSGK